MQRRPSTGAVLSLSKGPGGIPHREGVIMTEQTQWLHVFLDVAPNVAEESATFWSAALGWPLGEPWPGHPEFRSFAPPDGDPYVHSRSGITARGSTSISRLPTAAPPTDWSSWEQSLPDSLRDGAR